MAEQVADEKFAQISDFFELMAHGAEKKLKLVAENPYLMEFTVRVYSSRDERLAPGAGRKAAADAGRRGGIFQKY